MQPLSTFSALFEFAPAAVCSFEMNGEFDQDSNIVTPEAPQYGSGKHLPISVPTQVLEFRFYERRALPLQTERLHPERNVAPFLINKEWFTSRLVPG